MKLLTSQQIHEWDAYTIEHEPVTSIDLMERAARRCTDYIIDQQLIKEHIKIFCGKGNNGGDGLAIARQLIEAGMQPVIYILEFGAKGTEDFQTNLHRLHQLTSEIYFIQAKEFFPEINEKDLVIDALFGSGLNRPLKDLSAELVQHINQFDATVVAIDAPSGMFIDKSSKGNTVIRATYTLSFQSLKLCFLVPENAEFFGTVEILDIGLRPDFLQRVDTIYELVTKEQVQSYYKPRAPFSHKGNFGHVLLIAGNKGKMGAAIMTAKACLRTGAGLTTLNVPKEFLQTVHAAIPEAMCVLRGEETDYTKFNSLGIGPGIGTEDVSAKIVWEALKNFPGQMVIDADALNIIAQHSDWLNKISEGSIITPHPKEFERLFGKTNNDFERIELALQISKEYSFIIVLKGHYTLIAVQGKGYFNTTGNAGLAKGGSGDVLTGMLTALLAQQYDSFKAAILGVYLHGLAADIASEDIAAESMLAHDIINHISGAFLQLV
jgi:NAD(P)H-hydrate epimerase